MYSLGHAPTAFAGEVATARVFYRAEHDVVGDHVWELYYQEGVQQWMSGDLTALAQGPLAVGDPCAYVTEFAGEVATARVVYRAVDGHVWELYYQEGVQQWMSGDLTALAQGPLAVGDPCAYVTEFAGEVATARVVYRAVDGHVWELYYQEGVQQWMSGDLTALAQGPLAVGDPCAYVTEFAGEVATARVVYRAVDGHVWELYYQEGVQQWMSGDLTALAQGPLAVGDPCAYVTEFAGEVATARVVYRAVDGHVWELYYQEGVQQWMSGDLTALAQGPLAVGDPCAYVTEFAGEVATARVVYRAVDGHVWELYYQEGVQQWMSGDLTALAQGPLAVGDPCAYVTEFAGEVATARVVYGAVDGHVWELYYQEGVQQWMSGDLTTLAQGPLAACRSVGGIGDLHNHQFANLGFGGQAFWGRAYGDIATELAWCTPAHGPGGAGDVLGNTVKFIYGGGLMGHNVGGHPQFDGWPRWNSVSHQSVYEDWLKRAVDGGLRLIVMLAVNNENYAKLANRAPGRSNRDMEAVDLQLSEALAMESYIDNLAGGPGLGWYRVVRSPDEAYRVIRSGRLAVVLGIEVDYLFDCHGPNDLTPSDVSAQLDHYYQLGVRHVFPIHFSDNGYGGTAFQNDLIRDSTGGDLTPRNPLAASALGAFGFYSVNTQDGTDLGYEYRTGRRNVLGLTSLGQHLIHEMAARGMIIDIDHMSAKSKDETLTYCESIGYPVVSGHSGFNDICHGAKNHEGQMRASDVDRVRNLGGMVAPIIAQGSVAEIDTWQGAGQSVVQHNCGHTTESFVQAYLYAIQQMDGRSVGLGTDFNGFAGLPRPRLGNDATTDRTGAQPVAGVAYPFVSSVTGTQLDTSVIGQKVYDLGTDGLAHVGMLPDLIAELESFGLSPGELEPLLSSAHDYIRLWERAKEFRSG